MSVPSWQFLVFVLVGAVMFNAALGQWWRSTVWLALNLAFVWSFAHGVGPLLPLAGFLAIGYVGIAAAHTGRAWTAPTSIVLVLALFIWLKRYSFIPEIAAIAAGLHDRRPVLYILPGNASGCRFGTRRHGADQNNPVPEFYP